MTTATLAILQAVDGIYEQIREKFDGLPDVVFVVGASGVIRGGMKHGHFAPKAWEGDLHEIFLSGESLGRGAVATLGTCLHESAHLINHLEDQQDVTTDSQYHTKAFKRRAESMGLVIENAKNIGWSTTTVPSETEALYDLSALEAALITHRKGLLELAKDPEDPKPRKKTTLKVTCGCEEEDRSLTISKKKWENLQDTLMCGNCEEHYVEDEAEDE